MFVTHIISGNDFERAVLSLVLGAYAYTVQCYDAMTDFANTENNNPGCVILEVSERMLAQTDLSERLSALQQRFPLILMADERVAPRLPRTVSGLALPVIRRPVEKAELLNLLQSLRDAQPAG